MSQPPWLYWQSPGARTGSLPGGPNRAGGESSFLPSTAASGRAWQKGEALTGYSVVLSDRRGQQSGPVDSGELRRLAEAGIVRPDTLVRQGASGRWVHAETGPGSIPAIHASAFTSRASPPGPPPIAESGAPQ